MKKTRYKFLFAGVRKRAINRIEEIRRYLLDLLLSLKGDVHKLRLLDITRRFHPILKQHIDEKPRTQNRVGRYRCVYS